MLAQTLNNSVKGSFRASTYNSHLHPSCQFCTLPSGVKRGGQTGRPAPSGGAVWEQAGMARLQPWPRAFGAFATVVAASTCSASATAAARLCHRHARHCSSRRFAATAPAIAAAAAPAVGPPPVHPARAVMLCLPWWWRWRQGFIAEARTAIRG